MRKSDLHPRLRTTCVPVPGKSGCFAVVPPPVPSFIDVPSCHALIVLAKRELDLLGQTIAQNHGYADLLLHMLNRREAVDSSQIEGTHTSFDGLLTHEIGVNAQNAKPDPDADTTLNYVRAFMFGMIAQRLQVSFPAANAAVAELTKLDILRLARAQRRLRVFHAHEVMNALYTGLDDTLQGVVRQARAGERLPA